MMKSILHFLEREENGKALGDTEFVFRLRAILKLTHLMIAKLLMR